jgi:hypothetical protein
VNGRLWSIYLLCAMLSTEATASASPTGVRESGAQVLEVGNPREFLQAEKEDQQMAEACKRLIKNCIICWNYLYLSQKLAEIDDRVKCEEFLKAVARSSAVAWEHLNLLGEYDFSEDKLQDSVGIKPPKLTD